MCRWKTVHLIGIKRIGEASIQQWLNAELGFVLG